MVRPRQLHPSPPAVVAPALYHALFHRDEVDPPIPTEEPSVHPRVAAMGRVVDSFTENVDVFPTILDWLGVEIPAQCDGRVHTPWLTGDTPPDWRDAAHFEFDWRGWPTNTLPRPWPWARETEALNLAVRRDASSSYVQFADVSALYFDLTTDPNQMGSNLDSAPAFTAARNMLAWRMQHAERTLSGVMIDRQGLLGRLPRLPFEP